MAKNRHTSRPAKRILKVKFGKMMFPELFLQWMNNVYQFNKKFRESALKWICTTTATRVSSSGSKRSEPSTSVRATVTFLQSAWYFYSLLPNCRAFSITFVTRGSENDRQTRNILPCHDSAALRRKRTPSLEQAMIVSRMYFTTTIMIRLKIFFCLKFYKKFLKGIFEMGNFSKNKNTIKGRSTS